MTGFGRAEQTIGDKNYLVEIRSLNGKQFDLRLTLPALLKPLPSVLVTNGTNPFLIVALIESNLALKSSGSKSSVFFFAALSPAPNWKAGFLTSLGGSEDGNATTAITSKIPPITAYFLRFEDDWFF
ncbi:MAG: YicC/YloC family endoribonuclease [Armatimonadota bacterium]